MQLRLGHRPGLSAGPSTGRPGASLSTGSLTDATGAGPDRHQIARRSRRAWSMHGGFRARPSLTSLHFTGQAVDMEISWRRVRCRSPTRNGPERPSSTGTATRRHEYRTGRGRRDLRRHQSQNSRGDPAALVEYRLLDSSFAGVRTDSRQAWSSHAPAARPGPFRRGAGQAAAGSEAPASAARRTLPWISPAGCSPSDGAMMRFLQEDLRPPAWRRAGTTRRRRLERPPGRRRFKPPPRGRGGRQEVSLPPPRPGSRG